MDTPSQPSRRTPLFDDHCALGGRIVPFAGWEMPVQYTGIVDEHTAVRRAAGLFDVSHMGELELSGNWSPQVVSYVVTGDTSRLVPGQALYTCACNERGTILDDLIVYRHEEERFLVVCNASNRDKMAAVFRKAADKHCDFVDRSDETGLLALQGPRAFDVLERCGAGHLRALGSFHFAAATIASAKVTAARTGYTGEDGVEIFAPWGAVVDVWRALLEAGKGLGVKPVGLGARDTLRLEARLSLYGNDISEETNPIEAGLAWIVNFGKGDFVGRDVLEQVRAKALPRKIVGFEVTGRGIARHGYPLKATGGAVVGVCTSGSPAPTVGKNIGLGYLPSEMNAIGTRFLVDCRGKDVEAVVVKTPFYRRPAAQK